jgi:phosphorylase/glycogen(starch) synthase
VDVVTPNGFENSFTPATDEAYALLRGKARENLARVAAAMGGEPVPPDAVYVAVSGRYEYHNKGIDVFIDALAAVRDAAPAGRSIQAFILIPSGHHGPDRALAARLAGQQDGGATQVSHVLMDPEGDIITRRLRETGLLNAPGSRVKVYFIPSYLNGSDGIFDMPYYDLLAGMDLTLFPSYYEPWGYTPLESLAFRVPTLTTRLSGFGLWVLSRYPEGAPGITVCDRSDAGYADVVAAAASRVEQIAGLTEEEAERFRSSAREVSEIALWQKIADSGVITDIYAMYDYVNFTVDWPSYFVNGFTDASGNAVPGYYLYPADAMGYLTNDGSQWNYGYKDGYFEGIIKKVQSLDPTAFEPLVMNIRSAQALAKKAIKETP